jgi:hypothetical protein
VAVLHTHPQKEQRCGVQDNQEVVLMKEKVNDIVAVVASIGCLGALIIFIMVVIVGLFLLLRFLMGMF